MKRLLLLPLVALVFMGQGRGGPVRDTSAQPVGTAVIRGRIVAADTSAPLRRAQVRAASGTGRGARLVSTDVEGRFELRDLAPGRWELTASKAGFVTLRFGQRRPFEAGRPIELANGQVLEGVDIALPRGAAITGRVFDEFGDPLAGARVQVLRSQFVQGERQLTPTANAGVSDDTGAFRVYGLMPGDYYVSATLRTAVDDPNDDATFAPTYYPGTGSVAEAQRIAIGLGQEQGNINFSLMPVRAVRVSGTVVDSAGSPIVGGSITLMPSDSMIRIDALRGFGGNRVGNDGRFTIANVPPGPYTIAATAGRPRGPDVEVATMALFVGSEDVTGLTLVTSKGTTLSGRIVAAEGASTPLPAGLQVAVQSYRPGRGFPSRPTRPAPDGTFELTNLFGQGFIRLNGLPPGWMLASVQVAATDVTDTPIDFRPNEEIRVQVTVTNRVTELTGTVAGGDGKPVRDYTVVVFPDDETKWTAPSRFIRAARPDQQGLFEIRALPAHGRYLAVAVDYLEVGEANDPEFLASAKANGMRVALADGESKAIELKLLQR